MLLQASGLALLASLSPTALLIAAVYLGSARPRTTAAFYLAGALAMSAVMGVVLLVLLRSADLSRAGERGPRYDFRLGLGILLLVAGAVISRLKSLAHNPSKEQHGIVYRMAARPAPRSAFLVGILVFAPGRVLSRSSTGNRHGTIQSRTHFPGRSPGRRHQRAAGVGASFALPGIPGTDHTLFGEVQRLAARAREDNTHPRTGRGRSDNGRRRDLWSRLALPSRWVALWVDCAVSAGHKSSLLCPALMPGLMPRSSQPRRWSSKSVPRSSKSMLRSSKA